MESSFLPSADREPSLAAGLGSDDTAPPRKSPWRVISGALIALGLLALKLKGLVLFTGSKLKLLLVNPLEGLSVVQLATAGISMVVSVVASAVIWPFKFALGFVILTLVHELGHALVIRARGYRVGALVFLPLVGGAVTLKDQPRSAWDDAWIGLAGPVAGTLASLFVFRMYLWSKLEGNFLSTPDGNDLLLALAFAGFFINFFNLLPVAPLDGGRIAGAISKWLWLIGIIGVFVLMFRLSSPLLGLILLLGLAQVWRAVKGEIDPGFYELPFRQRATIAALYFGLVIYLGYQTASKHELVQAALNV